MEKIQPGNAMHIKDIEILGRLVSAIETDRLDAQFPSNAKGSMHAFYLGLEEIYRQRQPGQPSAHPALDEKILVDALDAWPMKDLLDFIMTKGNELPKLVHERLLEMVDSTATLGANAVLHLTDLEITLANKRGLKPREDLIAHFISSYGGRISLLRGLTQNLIKHFPSSELIDSALASHVPVHRMDKRSFHDVSTTSDLMMAVRYPKTLKACLQCLVEEGSEYKFQFFNDHANGRMPLWALNMYVEVLGHDQCLMQAGISLRDSYRAKMDNLDGVFRSFIEKFGASALLNTEAMRGDLEADEQKGVTSSFFKWYALNMQHDVPEYTDLAIPLVPAIIQETGKLPCSGFLISWKNCREPAIFLAEFLESVGARQSKKQGSPSIDRKFSDFEKILPAFDESLMHHTPATLVHGAFSPGAGLNEIALTIKSVLSIAGVEAVGKVLPSLSSTALHGICQLFGHTQHKQIMKIYPKASEFVMAVDLGL